MKFVALAKTITALDRSLRYTAITSVNRYLTLRNWLIGRYIVEY